MNLFEVKLGQVVRIKHIVDCGELKERLKGLGIIPGKSLTLYKSLPLGGVVIELGNGFLALRDVEAKAIEVELA
jgi:Fe2+ transport system protein FeoA